MIRGLQKNYDVSGNVDFDELEDFQVRKLRPIYKVFSSSINELVT